MRQDVKHGWIITVRHGRPDLSRDVVIDAWEYEEWWAQYNRSGLAPGERPSEQLLALGEQADHLISSGLLRAKETAGAVGKNRPFQSDEIFNEAPLPRPPIPFFKFRPVIWGFVSRLVWSMGYSAGGESHLQAIKRANQAADKLIEISSSGGNVILCAHGYFNWMLSVALRVKKWRRSYNGGHRFWSWRQFHKR